MLYFSINNDSLIYNLGDHENWLCAEEYALDNNVDSVMIINEKQAKQWVSFIERSFLEHERA